MGYLIKDFLCEKCNEVFEEMVEPTVKLATCPICTEPAEQIMSSPMIGTMNDSAKRLESLKKRSKEHSKREVAKEPEKFGMDKDKKFRKQYFDN